MADSQALHEEAPPTLHQNDALLPHGFTPFHPDWADGNCTNLAAWVCGIDDLRVLPYRLPDSLGNDNVRVQIKAVGICGSDVHYVKNLRNARVSMKEPMVLGHESAGIVTEVGNLVTNLKVGDHVALEPGIPCTCCALCKGGRYNLCPDVKCFGSPPVNGSLSLQVVHLASLCHKLPDTVSLEEGAMCEPLSVGVHACRRASIGSHKCIVILGAGPIGLVIMLVARAFGVLRIGVTDVDEQRLSSAKKLGADVAVLVSANMNDMDDEVAAIQRAMETPIDVTFDCVGFTKTMCTAIKITKPGGKVCLVGMGHDKMTLPLTAAAAREVDIIGIFRYCNTYPLCIELLQRGKIDVRPLITHRFGFSEEEVNAAFKMSASGGNAIKVMFTL
eukprot:c23982_g1_i1 orf=113-1276(+)